MSQKTEYIGIEDQYGFLKHLADVHTHKIRDIISSDWVLAKLETKEKDFLIEMSHNAIMTKILMDRMKERAIQYEFINNNWVEKDIDTKIGSKMIENSLSVFNNMIFRLQMIAILNRNVSSNYLIDKFAQNIAYAEVDKDDTAPVSEKEAITKDAKGK